MQQKFADLSASLSSRPLVDWQNVDKIFFDMDGTLLDLHFDNYFWLELVPEAYAQQQGVHDAMAAQELKRQLHQRIMREQGSLNWYCLDFWSHELALDIVALKRSISHKIQPLAHAIEFLDYLKNAGGCVQKGEKHRGAPVYELWLTTNAHRQSMNLKFSCTGIAGYFKHTISSHDFGHAKETQAFWLQLQQQHPFTAERVLFIDDSESVLYAARAYGIGQQLMILKPDSTLPARSSSNFKSIVNFQVLLDELKRMEQGNAEQQIF